MSVFGSSGVRGVTNADLTPAFALEVARAAGTVFAADRVAVARDPRRSGASIAAAVTAGLTAVGADGVELTRDILDAVEAALDSAVELAPWDAVGTVGEVEGALDRYCEELVAAVDREAIAGAELTVAIDPGHGAAAVSSPRIFRDLGCEVLTINGQQDGRFPGRDPEPVERTLGDLRRLVRTGDADLGIAHDGDGDRAIFVDETGDLVEGDAALAALADVELDAGDVAVSAVNASQRLVDVVEAVGAELRLTPIGSTHLITAVRAVQDAGGRVPVAGEGNGGVMFPDYRLARDGAYTAARFCELVAAAGSVSAAVADYDGYAAIRRNLAYEDAQHRERMLEAVRTHARAADAALDTTDGYRLDYGDAWVLARPSGTEPVIRVYAEARDEGRARALAEEMTAAIEAA